MAFRGGLGDPLPVDTELAYVEEQASRGRCRRMGMPGTISNFGINGHEYHVADGVDHEGVSRN